MLERAVYPPVNTAGTDPYKRSGRGVALHANLDKADAVAIARRLVAWLEDRGTCVRLTPETAGAVGRADLRVSLPDGTDGLDFLIVLGGDGSLLGAARLVAARGLPLLGVNLGRLGFLTEVEGPDLFSALPLFLRGEGEIEERAMLRVQVRRAGMAVWERLALNEAVVSKGPFARTVGVQVRAGGQPVAAYGGDGVIVATPTGSTAYSLSAGGPIVHPGVDALLITPICAHTLYARTLAVPSSEPITVRLAGDATGTVLTIDGHEGVPLERDDEVAATLAAERVRLLRRPGWSFYRVLSAKLPEGGLRDGG
ncbi:MAG TPA: NAD(+)/NADH kinase [Bacillota bacterium]|nr:NAD(+)/NADH kinase [Bacillota bacterium]